MQERKSGLLRLVIFGGVILIAFWFLNQRLFSGAEAGSKDPIAQDSTFYWQAWKTVKDNYIGRVTISEDSLASLWQTAKKDGLETNPEVRDSIFYSHVTKMVEAGADDHTIFFNPKKTKEFWESQKKKSYSGIGAYLKMSETEKKPALRYVFPDGPAKKAGLRKGDIIEAVDGKTTEGLTLQKAVTLIKGEPETPVELTISRKGWKKPKTFTVVRQLITPQTVYAEVKENIAYIKLMSFPKDVHKEFNNRLAEIFSPDLQGVILDLRDNPGGYVNEVMEILGHWTTGTGCIFHSPEDGNKKIPIAFGSRVFDDILKIPTVVLINKGSASGAEICAGALQDYEKAILVGEKTYGKGSTQIPIGLSRKCLLLVTTNIWITPYGWPVNNTGISPDIEIKMTDEDYANGRDPQLEKAFEIIKKEEK